MKAKFKVNDRVRYLGTSRLFDKSPYFGTVTAVILKSGSNEEPWYTVNWDIGSITNPGESSLIFVSRPDEPKERKFKVGDIVKKTKDHEGNPADYYSDVDGVVYSLESDRDDTFYVAMPGYEVPQYQRKIHWEIVKKAKSPKPIDFADIQPYDVVTRKHTHKSKYGAITINTITFYVQTLEENRITTQDNYPFYHSPEDMIDDSIKIEWFLVGRAPKKVEPASLLFVGDVIADDQIQALPKGSWIRAEDGDIVAYYGKRSNGYWYAGSQKIEKEHSHWSKSWTVTLVELPAK